MNQSPALAALALRNPALAAAVSPAPSGEVDEPAHVVRPSEPRDLPATGTITAAAFLRAVARRNVPWLAEKGTTHTTPTGKNCAYPGLDEDGMRAMLAGYVGWNPAEPFGVQLIAATQRAMREVQGSRTFSVSRAFRVVEDRTMPLSGDLRGILDLLGREALAGDEVVEARSALRTATTAEEIQAARSAVAKAEEAVRALALAVEAVAEDLGTTAQRLRAARAAARF